VFSPRDALQILSVCPSAHSVEMNKHIFKTFSQSGSHTILVFTAPRACIAQTMPWQNVCLSVFLLCLSVCLSHAGIERDILNSPLLRLTFRKPLWLDLQPVDIKSRWRHNWKSAQVVNSHLLCDPTIRQQGFDLPQQQWSLLNRIRT